MADLRAAAERLRASRQALPDFLRADWAADIGGTVTAGWATVVASTWLGDQPSEQIAAHIALTASPDVTDLIADLLAVIAQHDRPEDRHDYGVCFDAITVNADLLAAVILRERAS